MKFSKKLQTKTANVDCGCRNCQ